MKDLLARLPARSEVFSVYSVIVFLCYSWGVFVFMFNLPSWILMSPLGEVAAYFAYGLTFTFLDTILQLALVLLVTLLLPAAWLQKDFVVSGSVFAAMSFFWILVVQIVFLEVAKEPFTSLWMVIAVAVITTVLFVFVFRRYSLFRKPVLWLSSSTGVFVYIYGFLTAISLVAVLIRNLF